MFLKRTVHEQRHDKAFLLFHFLHHRRFRIQLTAITLQLHADYHFLLRQNNNYRWIANRNLHEKTISVMKVLFKFLLLGSRVITKYGRVDENKRISRCRHKALHKKWINWFIMRILLDIISRRCKHFFSFRVIHIESLGIKSICWSFHLSCSKGTYMNYSNAWIFLILYPCNFWNIQCAITDESKTEKPEKTILKFIEILLVISFLKTFVN